MVWFRVDDTFGDHPKVEALLSGQHADAAIALWTLAGAWCARHSTDGAITTGRVARLGITKHARGAAELVRVGLWTKTSDGFQFHQWAERQPSREEVSGRREADAARKRKQRSHGVTPDVTRDIDRDSHRDEVRDSDVTPSVTPRGVLARAPASRPDPSLPVPDPEEREHSGARAPEIPFDPGPDPTPIRLSQEPEAIVRRRFAAAYMRTRGSDWPHAAWAREIGVFARWADSTARAEGVDVEVVVERVISAACADAYLVGQDLRLSTINRQLGALYKPPPKATGRPKILNTALIRSCRDDIETERKRPKPNADLIASLERCIAAEQANPSGEPEEPRGALARHR